MAGPEAWLNVVAAGNSAVTGFFVLSGFVLARNYALPDGTMRGTKRDFWMARFARVYPIYVLSLILIYQAYLTTAPRTLPEVIGATLAALTLTQAWWPETALAINSAAWSLSVEAFLYLLFPLLLPVVRRRAAWWLAGVVVVNAFGPGMEVFNPLVHLPAFVAGIAAASLGRGKAWWAGVSAVVIVAVLASGKGGVGLLLLPYVGLVMGLAEGNRWIGSTPMVRLGEASYSLYLLHLPLWPWGMAIMAADDSWGFVLLCFAVSLAGAFVAYRYVEEPYRKSLRGMPQLMNS